MNISVFSREHKQIEKKIVRLVKRNNRIRKMRKIMLRWLNENKKKIEELHMERDGYDRR